MVLSFIIFIIREFQEKNTGEERGRSTNQNINSFRFYGERLFLPGGRRKKNVSKIYNRRGCVRAISNCFLNGSQGFTLSATMALKKEAS